MGLEAFQLSTHPKPGTPEGPEKTSGPLMLFPEPPPQHRGKRRSLLQVPRWSSFP